MRWRGFALALLLVLGATAWASGLVDWLREPEHVRAFLTQTGALGPLVFVLAFALLEPFGLPGAIFVIPASLVWPAWLAVALSVTGAVGAGMVGYGFARWLGRDWAEARMPASLRAMAARARERELRTVILVRLVFFLAAPAHWALGLAGIRLRPFLLGSALGFAPGMVALVLGGREAFLWLREQEAWVWGLFVAGLLLAWLVVRRLQRGRTPATHGSGLTP